MKRQKALLLTVVFGITMVLNAMGDEEAVFNEKITPPQDFEWVNKKANSKLPKLVISTNKNDSTEDKPALTLPAIESQDPRPFTFPLHYICLRTDKPLQIDGLLDEPAWKKAVWSEAFVDIEGYVSAKTPLYSTRMKMLWDSHCLYIAAQLQKPHIWATLTEQDSIIFNDNNFEVFLDPNGDSQNYFEFEMNALNTVRNLVFNKPFKNGGVGHNRPMPGQKTAVYISGTLNNPADYDQYWQVEIAFPFAGLKEWAGCPCPPRDGDQWRINFSRVEWECLIEDGKYVRIPPHGDPSAPGHEQNWVWSPQGVINMHRPETWGYLQFSNEPAGTIVAFEPDLTAWARYELHRLLYAQELYHLNFGSYAESLDLLGLDGIPPLFAVEPILIEAGPDTFKASVKLQMPDLTIRIISIDQQAKITVTPN